MEGDLYLRQSCYDYAAHNPAQFRTITAKFAPARAKQPQNADFYAEKGKLFCKFCSSRMDHSRQSVLSAHCIGDTHKKQKERAAQAGQIQGSLSPTLPVPNEARLDNLILISDWVRALLF